MEIDDTDNAYWAQFKSGEDVSLAIEKCAPDYAEQGSKMVGRFVGVTLMVDDIADHYNRLAAKGVAFTGPPQEASLGWNTGPPEGSGRQRAHAHAGSRLKSVKPLHSTTPHYQK
jgi:hypothetical protein